MTTTTISSIPVEADWRGHPRLRGGQPPLPHPFNPEQMKALAVICDTFVPSIGVHTSEVLEKNAAAAESKESLAKGDLDDVDAFYKLSGSDVGLSVEVAGHLCLTQKTKVVKLVGFLLTLFNSSLGTLLLFGRAALSWRYPFMQSFVDLPPERREKALLSWSKSSFSVFVILFKLFKGYTLLAFYGTAFTSTFWLASSHRCGQDKICTAQMSTEINN